MAERTSNMIREALAPPRDEGQRRRVVDGVADRIRSVAQDGLPPEPGLRAPDLRSGPFRQPWLMLAMALSVLLVTVSVVVGVHFMMVARAKAAADCNKPPAPQTTPSADQLLKGRGGSAAP